MNPSRCGWTKRIWCQGHPPAAELRLLDGQILPGLQQLKEPFPATWVRTSRNDRGRRPFQGSPAAEPNSGAAGSVVAGRWVKSLRQLLGDLLVVRGTCYFRETDVSTASPLQSSRIGRVFSKVIEGITGLITVINHHPLRVGLNGWSSLVRPRNVYAQQEIHLLDHTFHRLSGENRESPPFPDQHASRTPLFSAKPTNQLGPFVMLKP